MRTIIQKLQMKEADGNSFYIKRDDLLPFSMGGNKVRIAETFLRDMREKNCDSMIIYGSVHSNLCRVLSNLCRAQGIDCCMICSHEEGEPETAGSNTRLIGWTGTRVVHCAKTEIADTVEAVMEEYKAGGKAPYYIYGTKYGTGNEGVAADAYVKAYGEIREAEREQGWEFDYIFCAHGTGATQSGLVCGSLLAADSRKIVGILISSRETARAHEVMEKEVIGYFRKNGYVLPADFRGHLILADQYRAGGYGKFHQPVRECIFDQYLTNGIPLDPVYTAKAFWGMCEYIREHQIRDSRVLFLHTGGTPLFYDFLAEEGAV